MQRAFISLFFSTLPLVTLSCLIPLTAEAQISADGTTSTKVNQNGNDFTIEQGSRVDDNLFHSFNEFSVPTGGSAAFNNASDIANIFSRVTGSNISSIDGLISANGAANLFLINPNGIIFGENARLDLGGSFFASTADSLLFEGNKEFSASNPQTAPLLEVSIPIGINFRDNPGDIVNRSVAQNSTGDIVGLEVAPGENLTLVGGNINFEAGNTTASGGDIELGGLSEAGTVGINDDGSLNFPENVAKSDITITDSVITTETFETGDAGELSISAGSVDITDSVIANQTLGTEDAGSINIDVNNDGAFNLSNSVISTETFGKGKTGDVSISAGSVNLTDFSVIATVTSNEGNAGDVSISAGSVDITDSVIANVTFGTGDAGSININVNNDGALKLFASVISTDTSGEGNAGKLSISAGSVDINNFSVITTQTRGEGNAGKLSINAGSVDINNFSVITTQTRGEGNAGDFSIIAGSVDITDTSVITTETFGTGDAGKVTITNNSLSLTNSGRVSASTFGTGNAGNVIVNARESITISGTRDENSPPSRLSASAFESSGKGGNINVSTNRLTIDDGGTIEAGNVDSLDVFDPGTGKPGNINIEANSLSLSNEARIEATTQSKIGEAANIKLTIAEDIFLKNNSLISARAEGVANGGNINIDAEFIIAFPSQLSENGNDIVANAVEGEGGNIKINAAFLAGIQKRRAIGDNGDRLRNGTNDIDASSEFNRQGEISVKTQFDPLIELPEEVGDVSDQIAQNPCEQGVGSEFFITGKGGLRPNPHETLSSDRVPVTLVEPVLSKQGDGETGSPETSTPEAVPAQGWIFTDTGEVMLTSYIPSAMAEVTPPTPVAQTSTNPSQLATQAEKLYQNQEFDAAAAFWEQAAQAFAVSGDNLNQAMALSNLSLTYQHLGKWENANQAIQDSLTALNAAPENSHLVAQTLDIQGKLQREMGQPAAAIDTWQKAANIYQKLDKSAALTQNNLNQAQAFQDLGLYTRACQTILASLKMENITTCQDLDRLTREELALQLDKIAARPSLQKVLGLRRLGDLLLVIGQPRKSRQILATSLTLAKQLNSPSEIAATYLSMGKTAHSFTTKEAERSRTKRRNNQQQALEAYRQAIASSPDLITQQQAKLNQFSLLLQNKQWSKAASLSPDILNQIANLSPSRSNIYAQINFAHTLIELLDRDKPQPPAEIKLPSVREIERILTKAIANAQTLGDNRLEAYALGDRGRLYELTGQLALAEQYTQQAIALISTLDSADIAYQYLWQLGRIQNRQGELEKAISAYTKAYNALQSLRSDLATINPQVQFSFRDEVEPVYRELVGLNFKYVQTLANKANTKDKQKEITAKLIQARDVMESLQLAQLNNFFREACIDANPQQIDKIDRNAAVIYTIVLPDKLGILLSLPNRPPMLYPVDVTQAEISEAVKTMRRSLKTSSIPVAKTLPESQKIYDWLIRPLEAELAKNEVKTIAFVLDDDLRNIPMAVLHDGKQYLVEKYALALTSGLQLLDPKPLTAIELNAIAAGLSKSQDDSDVLPGVAAELQAMQAIGLTDRYLLNEKFTKQALKQNIADSSSPILHLATLAQFSPKAEDTFILTWGDRINIKEFADLLRFSTFKRKNAIELLVLSAGETAAGDSRASLGLAGVALQAGVRSTLATVWPVVDVSTAKIMERFYLELKEASKTKVNKAEALRQAQLALIKDKQFNHPHYWAPFILIGNWQ